MWGLEEFTRIWHPLGCLLGSPSAFSAGRALCEWPRSESRLSQLRHVPCSRALHRHHITHQATTGSRGAQLPRAVSSWWLVTSAATIRQTNQFMVDLQDL